MTAFSAHTQSQDQQIIQFSMRKSTLYALLISLFLHLIIFYFLQPWRQAVTPTIANQPLSVRLVSKESSQQETTPLERQSPQPAPLPTTKKLNENRAQANRIVKIQPKPLNEQPTPPVQTKEQPSYAPPVSPPPAVEPAKQNSEVSPPTDMQSYIAAQRAKRAATQGVAGDVWQDPPQSQELNDDARRDAVIQRNLQMGVNGLFQIVNLSEQHAQFTFKGWRNSISSAKQELIQVEAAPGEDIQHAVVRRMIALIRRYHQQDFNWESQRLGRVVVLSARPADTAGLEEFLIAEFFASNGKSFN